MRRSFRSGVGRIDHGRRAARGGPSRRVSAIGSRSPSAIFCTRPSQRDTERGVNARETRAQKRMVRRVNVQHGGLPDIVDAPNGREAGGRRATSAPAPAPPDRPCHAPSTPAGTRHEDAEIEELAEKTDGRSGRLRSCGTGRALRPRGELRRGRSR